MVGLKAAPPHPAPPTPVGMEYTCGTIKLVQKPIPGEAMGSREKHINFFFLPKWTSYFFLSEYLCFYLQTSAALDLVGFESLKSYV